LTLIAIALAVPNAASASVGNFGMAVQPDGRIVVAGGLGRAIGGGRGKETGAVARYLPAGKLDPSFGKRGVSVVRSHSSLTGPVQPFTALALQPDGRILLASPIGELSRLLPNGKPDPSFGVGGIAPAGTISAHYPTAVAVEGDGSILVGGTTGYLNDPGEHLYGRLYRYTPNGRSSEWIGAISPSTGQSDPKSSLSSFIFGPSGSVIAAGGVGPRTPQPVRDHAALARLVPGAQDSPDPTFAGGAGLVESAFFPTSPLSETANALANDRDGGGLLLAGQAENEILLARYRSDGFLAGHFGRGGAVLTNVHGAAVDSANAVLSQRHGERIVVAGSSGYGCGSQCASLVVAAYRGNGRPDPRFGHRGVVSPRVRTSAYDTPAEEIAYGLAEAPGERILVGGLLSGPYGTRFFLRRYLPSGRPDKTFGNDGRVVTLPYRVSHGQR